MKLLWCGYLAP